MFFTVFILITLTVLLLHCKFRYSRKGRLIDKIPGPRGYPFIGNIIEWQLDMVGVFKKFRETNSKYERFHRFWLFGLPIVGIYDPDDIEVLMTNSQHNDKSLFYELLRPWLGDGLLLSKGSKWYERRKILTPAFHFGILKQACKTFNEHSSLLVDELRGCVGQDVNISDYIIPSVLNALCETTMGIRTDKSKTSNRAYRKAVHEASLHIVWRACRPWYNISFLFNLTSMGQIHKRTLETLHNFTRNVIQQRRAEESFRSIVEVNEFDEDTGHKKQKLAMLDLLLHSESKQEIDEVGIQEEVDTFMFEGHDTVSMSLIYTLMLIANHPDVQAKIYNEIIHILGETEETTMEHLHQMKYLECVIKESLRLYPSVPFISRLIKEDLELKGYTIPGGTVCHIHIYDVHRNKKYFNEPERFDPDRFLPENAADQHPFAYIPFSAASRNCIGQRYAKLEAKSIISAIIRRFVLKPVTKPEELQFIGDLLLRTTKPVQISLVQRIQ